MVSLFKKLQALFFRIQNYRKGSTPFKVPIPLKLPLSAFAPFLWLKIKLKQRFKRMRSRLGLWKTGATKVRLPLEPSSRKCPRSNSLQSARPVRFLRIEKTRRLETLPLDIDRRMRFFSYPPLDTLLF